MPHEFPITDTPRYREIADRFGMIAHEQGICGCHVHVAVPDREAAIRVSNRLRPWLPLLLGADRELGDLPQHRHRLRQLAQHAVGSAGPARDRRRISTPPTSTTPSCEMLQDTGAMLDDGMVYWDVRPSANFPTIEVRVADVPATVAETVLLATLIRACVMTALEDERRGEPTAAAGAARAAGRVLEVGALRPRRRRDRPDGKPRAGARASCSTRLVDHVRPALEAVGDYDMVTAELARIAERRQRCDAAARAWQRRHDVADVLAEAARRATLE